MRKFLFVINPIAGGNDKAAYQHEIEAWFKQHQLQHQWMATTGEDDAQSLRKQLEQHAPDAVVACGGDGTVNLVARTLLGTSTPMGIVPLGSANGLATDLSIPGNVGEALDVLLHGHTMEVDGLLINKEHYAFHLADMGYNARLVQEFESNTDRGKSGYARSFLRVARNRPLAKFDIKADDLHFRRRSIMATFANARRYGTGAIVNPNGKLDDGRFELCLFLPWPRWYLLWISVLFFIGQIDKSRYVEIVSCQKLQLSVDRPLPLQVDGELVGEHTEVRVEIVPEKVIVLVPDNEHPR